MSDATISTTPIKEYQDRATALQEALVRLKRDREQLAARVAKQRDMYGDEKLERHLKLLASMIDRFVAAVAAESETNGRRIWREAHESLRGYLDMYRRHLERCPGRREYCETQECLRQLTQVMEVLQQGGRSGEERDLTCCICRDAEVNVSIACGHLLCDTCAQSVDTCPLCRARVRPADIRPLFL